MKKSIILSILFLVACKENPNEEILPAELQAEVVDTTSTAIEANDVVAEQIDTAAAAEQPKELTYSEAIKTTSVSDLKLFIENNPQHTKIKKLKIRLIDLEVDEISRNESTGQMPQSEKTSSSNSETSKIEITNDTSCELEVRYSGRDSKMIVIQSRQTQTISILSGDYRVTASACDSNYAGTETLSGNYQSSYYIATTRR